MNRRTCRHVLYCILLSAFLVSCGGDTEKSPAPTEPPAAAKPEQQAKPEAAVPVEELAEPLLAWAEAEPEEGAAPLTVKFTADIEGGTPPIKIEWDFGDDSPKSTEKNPVHVYKTAGSYQADLSAEDSAGDSDSDWVDIDVE